LSRRVHWAQPAGDLLEKEIVAQCMEVVEKMGAFMELAGQYRADGSGSSVGFPDAFLYCAGKCLPVEFKTRTGRLSPGQVKASEKRLDQHVHTWIIRDRMELKDLINW
jgi:hypothetical protein